MKTNVHTLLRIIFQFSDKCNMACPYCYCRFTNEPIDSKTCFQIINRCHEIGVKVITFAGGDPLSCTFIWDLIRYAKSMNIEVHVDTNGLSLDCDKYDTIAKYVSLISFPIDGPSAIIHEAMRGSRKHYDFVIEHLSKIGAYGCRVKINTVVASINYTHLPELGRLLENYGVAIWSLQQFWPMEKGKAVADRYMISDEDYAFTIKNIKNHAFSFLLEYGVVNERRYHHFFVTHSGRSYVHSPQQQDSYTELGSFFDPLTLERWKSLACSSVHPNAFHRYQCLQK